MDAKRTLKATDIERLENTSLASLLGSLGAHAHDGGLEGATPLCCIACSATTVCTFYTCQSCEPFSAGACVVGCTVGSCAVGTFEDGALGRNGV